MNILGSTEGVGANDAQSPEVSLHLYNKTPAPLRKLGHLNVAASSEDELLSSLNELHEKLYGAADSSLGVSRDTLAKEA